ncbi:Mab-21 domain-containing protein [Aphelenchoides fujianensis]|nr:Mab-21 domain-containing protein [Aphelenchoides fujianensis]
MPPTKVTYQQINAFINEKVNRRRADIQEALPMVIKVLQELHKDVETQEPRFIPTLIQPDEGSRYIGFHVLGPHEYEVVFYLNQMGVFNFVDDGSLQGCAVLKLSDGRKRSMSLWVEFITASGYLSARKIRSRFQALVAQSLEKPQFRDKIKMINDTSDVRLQVYDKFNVKITCAFRCTDIWPRSANRWPPVGSPWPTADLIKHVENEGFDLFSLDFAPPVAAGGPNAATSANKQQQGTANSMEGDAWVFSMSHLEKDLLGNHQSNRHKTYSILRTLRDRHLNFPGSPITYSILRMLVLFECEKHVSDHEWQDYNLGDRLIGVLLQLVSCLQCRKCPHYFLSNVDLFRGKSPQILEHSAKVAWNLVRQLLLCENALETL